MARVTVALEAIRLEEDTDMAALLRSLMIQSGIRGAELARTIGHSHYLISMWRVGKRAPNQTSLVKIADAFGYELALVPKGAVARLADEGTETA